MFLIFWGFRTEYASLTNRSRHNRRYNNLNKSLNVSLEGLAQCFKNYWKNRSWWSAEQPVSAETSPIFSTRAETEQTQLLVTVNHISPQMIFMTHNEPQRAAWMVCMCVSTVGDMWLVFIIYRSNLLAHCLWGISGMGTFPTLYLQELCQSEGKTLLYLLLKSRQVFFFTAYKNRYN